MATKINLDTSQRVDITCRKGDTFSLRLTLTDNSSPPVASFKNADVFKMEVRTSDLGDSDSDIVENGSNTDFSIVKTASSTDVTAGFVDLSLAASVMETMPSGLYVYDIEQKVVKDNQDPPQDLADPTVATLIHGTIKINEDVTITS
jgi:hypothetical protein